MSGPKSTRCRVVSAAEQRRRAPAQAQGRLERAEARLATVTERGQQARRRYGEQVSAVATSGTAGEDVAAAADQAGADVAAAADRTEAAAAAAEARSRADLVVARAARTPRRAEQPLDELRDDVRRAGRVATAARDRAGRVAALLEDVSWRP